MGLRPDSLYTTLADEGGYRGSQIARGSAHIPQSGCLKTPHDGIGRNFAARTREGYFEVFLSPM